jgi:hypothetical protein
MFVTHMQIDLTVQRMSYPVFEHTKRLSEVGHLHSVSD